MLIAEYMGRFFLGGGGGKGEGGGEGYYVLWNWKIIFAAGD